MVHSKFGGQIFGFDIDQNGTEGVLSEAKTLSNGNVLAAVETFDQNTGNILQVVVKTQTQDDFVTLGVVGTSVGLIEREHVVSFLHVRRTFHVLNPLSGNKFTGVWTPPIGAKHIIEPGGVSRSQGVPNVAVFASDNSGRFTPLVFSSSVAANTFGPVVKITDSGNFGSVPPPIALDSTTNQAVLGGGPGCFGCLPVIGLVDLVQGTFTEFTGIGFGFINGLAVDSADGIACTTTEDDANVEFYDLANQTGFSVVLPGSNEQQFFSGADVEFDSVHKLFLVAQPNSSSAASGSTIYVYDMDGNLKETLNGFSFSNTFNVVPAHIALNPKNRSGFVDGPDAGVTAIQSFTY
ncbi:MAG: TolB-like 6-bladed beta-propeller domain-containing protein [Acidobacteriia bacterium]|nr:TolB-like 6-bladed beta-propeller domain-containing protein [Terriglobia bacterium]